MKLAHLFYATIAFKKSRKITKACSVTLLLGIDHNEFKDIARCGKST